MDSKDLKIVAIIAVVAVCAIAAMVLINSGGENQDLPDEDPVKPIEPEPEPPVVPSGKILYNYIGENQIVVDGSPSRSLCAESGMIYHVVAFTITNDTQSSQWYNSSSFTLNVGNLTYSPCNAKYTDSSFILESGSTHEGSMVFYVPETESGYTMTVKGAEIDTSLKVNEVPKRIAGQIYAKISYEMSECNGFTSKNGVWKTPTLGYKYVVVKYTIENVSCEEKIIANDACLELQGNDSRYEHNQYSSIYPGYTFLPSAVVGTSVSNIALFEVENDVDISTFSLVWTSLYDRAIILERV